MIKTILFLSLMLVIMFSPSVSAQDIENACACCSENYRSFDFWLGEWEVYANEKLAGTNTIKIDQDSCLLIENWRSSNSKITGTSYNYYNKTDDCWEQLWIDNRGSHLKLTGGFVKGKMVMQSGKMISRKGEEYINRITWIPKEDGSVRQHWEISRDDGETWETIFDGLYIKKGTG